MESQERPGDESRRRVLVGVGAIAVGALGAGALLALSGGPTPVPASPPTTGLRAAPAPSSTGRSSTTTTTTTPTSVTTTPTTGSPVTSRSVQTTTTTVPGRSVVVACRDVWGATPAADGMVRHQPVRLTLHHTAVGQTALHQGPARARRHQRYHQSLGWADLAYHFLVDRSGLAYEGRDVAFRGDTGTEYDPTGHFLVCMEGDFDVQEPTAVQLEATIALFAWASQRYGIDPVTLAGHGAYAATSCPGSSVSARIPEIAAEVAGSGPVAMDLVCGDAGAELIAALEAG